MFFALRAGTFVIFISLAGGAQAETYEEVKGAFDEFVAAQNAHDLEAVSELLQDSPDFLWITRGAPIWGRDAALERFEALYQGTWSLDPAIDELKVVGLGSDAAQLYVPITFMIAPAGESAQPTRFLMNLLWVASEDGWKIASILPIPVPPQ